MNADSEATVRPGGKPAPAEPKSRSRFDRWKKDWLLNSSRVYLKRYNAEFARNTKAKMLVLDAGAGHAPYRPLFRHARYEAADFVKLKKQYAEQTYICDLTDIPVEDGRFDRVVFNQVLEHLPDPSAALRELYRVTKAGGQIICTCPLFYEEHQKPYDFYRYTQFGLKKVFTDAGFAIQRLEWMEGYFGTIGYQLEGMYRHLPRELPARLQRLPFWKRAAVSVFLSGVRALALGLAGVFYRLDLRWKVTGAGYPKNYVLVAKKPLSAAVSGQMAAKANSAAAAAADTAVLTTAASASNSEIGASVETPGPVVEAWLATLSRLVSVKSKLASDLTQRLAARTDLTPAQRERLLGVESSAQEQTVVPVSEITFGVMNYRTPDPKASSRNIGDWVQTISMMSHLVRRPDVQLTGDARLVEVFEEIRSRIPVSNRIDGPTAKVRLVEFNRDATLDDALPEHTWAFVFGWFMKSLFGNPPQFPLNANISPLFLSLHISRADFLTPAAVEYLRAHGPVGCRDWHTVRLLLAQDVPAYFSGCVTTTIGSLFPPAVADPTKPVAFVDVEPPQGQAGAVRVKNLQNDLRVRPLDEGLADAVQRIEEFRTRYSRIVTSRLHAYLPSWSCGVDVEWRPEREYDVRFEGLVGPSAEPRDPMRNRIGQIARVLLDAVLGGKTRDEIYAIYRDEVAADLAYAPKGLVALRERLAAHAAAKTEGAVS
jgi:SAM-dependent methyltransferase